MKGFKCFFLFLFLIAAALSAQQSNRSLSLITVYPGDAIYSAFGHTAFRYVDQEKGIDRLYNSKVCPRTAGLLPGGSLFQAGIQELYPSGEQDCN